MTKLSKPVRRITPERFNKRNVVITIATASGGTETIIGLRLLGTREGMVVRLDDLYRTASLWHANRVMRAKKEARRNGVPWKKARRKLIAECRV